MIILASVFRNSSDYIGRYAEQVTELRKLLHDPLPTEPLYVITVEGDSTDNSYEKLLDSGAIDEVLRCEHGGPSYGSVVHPLRWRQLSVACNTALCAAVRVANPGDRFIYIESDLVWTADTMYSLVDILQRENLDGLAPMSFAEGGGRFYDIWGHTKNGYPFQPYAPYHRHLDGTEELTHIDSAGSCFALSRRALQIAEFSAIDCIRGIGRSLKENDMQLWLTPQLAVYHP